MYTQKHSNENFILAHPRFFVKSTQIDIEKGMAAAAAFVCQFSTRAIFDIMYTNFSGGVDIYENVLPPRKVPQSFPPERFFSHCAYFIYQYVGSLCLLKKNEKEKEERIRCCYPSNRLFSGTLEWISPLR
jgi:hypothetical protein